MPVDQAQESLKRDKRLSVDFREISLTGSEYYHTAGIPDYNPDDLAGRKGLQIYRKMRDDDQIKAVLSMKKFARLMTPWEIQPASQDAKDIEIADFVRINLENLSGTFEDSLLNILTALDYGYSLTEKLWYRIERGTFVGKIGLKALKTREPFYYQFESDIYGNLREDGVIYLGPGMMEQVVQNKIENTLPNRGIFSYGSRLPVDKFVIYSYNKEFSNWYGRSDLRAAYRSFWSKEILIRFMNIYMERFGMPTHVGTYPKNMSKVDRESLKTILDRVQSKYSIVIPEDVKIDLLNAGGGGEGTFRSAIEMHNKFMSRSLLVPDLLGFTESSGGAYALGKKHFDVFLWILQKLGRDLEETVVGEQILKQLVDFNYSNVEKYPKFKFESITAEGTATRANIIQMGVAGGFINPEEEWIREYLAIPKRDEQFALGFPQQQPQQNLIPEKIETEEGLKDVEDKIVSDLEGTEEKEFKLGAEYVNAVKRWKGKKYEKVQPDLESKVFQKKPETGFALPLDDRFDYKVDFVQIKDDLNEYEKETVDSLSKIVQLQRDALLKTIERKGIVENNDYDAVNALNLKYVGDFKRELENRLIKLHLDSKLETIKEVAKGSNGQIDVITKFANVAIQPWIPVQPMEAIDFFNRKVLAKIITTEGIKKLITLATRKELDYYDAKAFAISGIEKDTILKKAKLILLNGMKNGAGTKEVMSSLGNMFDDYLTTGEIKDEELVTPARLETIVRTNFSEALNMGRKKMIDNPDLEDFVPFVRYSAILDDRVRSTHAAVHGMIFKRDDPIVDEINPPNGFNCFPAGTLVNTFCGRKKIEDVKHGDIVVTHLGNNKKVIELHRNNFMGELIELELENGKKLIATPNHLILTKNRSWIKISEITLEDNLETIFGIRTRQRWFGEKGKLRKEKWGAIISILNKTRSKEEHPCFGKKLTPEEKLNVSIGTRIAMKRPDVILKYTQVQRELNLKCGGNHRVKPVELSSVDEAVKQEAIGSLAR